MATVVLQSGNTLPESQMLVSHGDDPPSCGYAAVQQGYTIDCKTESHMVVTQPADLTSTGYSNVQNGYVIDSKNGSRTLSQAEDPSNLGKDAVQQGCMIDYKTFESETDGASSSTNLVGTGRDGTDYMAMCFDMCCLSVVCCCLMQR